MQQIIQSDSKVYDSEQNQFISQSMQYETCPFCSRSFFRGKLAYHLKHCNSQKPMIKTNKNSSKHTKNSLSAFTACSNTSSINNFIVKPLVVKFETKQKQVNLNQHDKDQEEDNAIQSTIFPKISTFSSRERRIKQKRILIKFQAPKPIPIKQQLRCMRIAQQVQKIECTHCGRRFSTQAGQRHIPICSIIQQKQKNKIFFSRQNSPKTKSKIERIKLQSLGKSFQIVTENKTFLNQKSTQKQAQSRLDQQKCQPIE